MEEFLSPEPKSATCGDPVQPSPSEPVVSLLHGRHPICKYDGTVFAETSTGRLVVEGEEQNRDPIASPRFSKRPSTGNSTSPLEGVYPPTEYLCRINSGGCGRCQVWGCGCWCWCAMCGFWCVCNTCARIVVLVCCVVCSSESRYLLSWKTSMCGCGCSCAMCGCWCSVCHADPSNPTTSSHLHVD